MSERMFILVPVHNRRSVTTRFAELLARQSFTNFGVVLIDDGSTDGTADAVSAILPRTHIIRGDGTWWWAGCMDAACRWLEARDVGGDVIIGLFNDDVEFGSEFLAEAVREMAEHPGTLVLPRQLDAATGAQVEAGGGVDADVTRLRFAETADPRRINCLPTRGLFLRWADLQRAGGFRPHRVRHYLADYEFTFRARRRGLRLRVSDRLAVRTHVSATGPTRDALAGGSRADRLRLLFSHRFKENPRDWLGFVWSAAPPLSRPWLTLKVCANTLRLAARALRSRS